jgi:GxxExxY protein
LRYKSKPESAEGAEETALIRGFDPAENLITEKIIGAAIEVHRLLGPGLLESAYEQCLCYELSQMGLRFQRQVPLPVAYKGLHLDCAYKLDLVVEDAVIVEIKAIEELLPIHKAQLLTYLKASGKSIGLLINFNVPVLKNGIRRLVNGYAATPHNSAPSAPEPGEDATPDNLSNASPRHLRVLRASAVNKEPAVSKEAS